MACRFVYEAIMTQFNLAFKMLPPLFVRLPDIYRTFIGHFRHLSDINETCILNLCLRPLFVRDLFQQVQLNLALQFYPLPHTF